MVAYLETVEIESSLQILIHSYVKDCMEGKEMSEDFVELIKHNFLAKYVYYNREKEMIEIGVNHSKTRKSYPEIKVYSFPLAKAAEWVGKKFKTSQRDLKFYGTLINSRKCLKDPQIVVM
ncbi:hypothetical protein [Autumnicola musiva]|uniref:Uncharacterized protein n=1 Tax=Autumnicola musiva TaxID=3075589 RepID=A0ABU3D935_9FLAO|nr:hypothetical protein [Zunongwangia sp. F117]MDT0677854.1 hypothetical protein [Zunongwangia sp. F117]